VQELTLFLSSSCHRLKKHCESSDGFRKRKAETDRDTPGGKKRVPGARIVQLEDKLDTLVAQLHSQNILNDTPSQIPPLPHSIFSVSDSLDKAEVYLGAFRHSKLPNFPLVHLPPSSTYQELQAQHPILCEAIMAATSADRAERAARGRRLKSTLCNMPASIDLLLGVLVYIAWGWDHVVNSGSLSRLTMLATSIAGELRLGSAISANLLNLGHFTNGFESHTENEGNGLTGAQFLERQRGLLACFALSSA